VAALGVLALTPACEESPVIGEREKVTHRFVDITREVINGQDRRAYTVNVPGDAIHPHLEGRWTVNDVERPVDTFVFREGDYDAGSPPGGQQYFWTSTTTGTGGVNSARSQSVRVHPTPGNWVIVFYNPAINPFAGRTELSAEVEISFFR
jgi:hypothetical protein